MALEALRGDKAAQEIAARHKLHPGQVSTWKRRAIDGLTGVLSDKVKKAENKHAKIGQLAVENDFLSQGLKYYRQGQAPQYPERR